MKSFSWSLIGLAMGAAGGYWAGHTTVSAPEPLAQAEREIVLLKGQLSSSQTQGKTLSEVRSTTAATPADGEPKPDINKLFNDAKPLLKTFTAAFEPQRRELILRTAEEQLKRMTTLANLSLEQQTALKTYLTQLGEKEQQKWQEMLSGKGGIADIMKMGRGGPNPQKSLDEWAKTNLEGEQAKTYDTARLGEKAKALTDSANAQLETMSTSLNLEEAQKDQLFHVLVRTDNNYDPAMQIEGAEANPSATSESREDAIATILNPEQRTQYQAQQKQKKQREGGFFKALGLPEMPKEE